MRERAARKLFDVIQLKLRLSEELRRRVEDAASANRRSMNSEILVRLEATFKSPEMFQ